MARYIDKEFEINHYHSMLVNPTPDVTSIDKRNAKIILDALKMAKTVDVPDRNVGKWIEIKHTFFHKCSQCSWLNDVDSGYNFCPRCGSYNGGEQDEYASK